VLTQDIDLNNVSYYVIEIRITDIATPRSFYPKLEIGVITVDRYELEDLIRYCGIKYNILRGYYWNGRTINVAEFIKRLYKKKQAAIGVQRDCIKKALNSIYGNCLKKGYKKELHKYFETDADFQRCLVKNAGRIHNYDEAERKIWLQRTLDLSSNHCQLGSAVLSMSKRIMNRYFDILDSAGVPCYVSNTDSLLMPTNQVHLLQKYIGDELGMLHIECKTDEAIVIRSNLYYISDEHFRSAGITHKSIVDSGSIKQYFIGRL
jgi:hypothetical protein